MLNRRDILKTGPVAAILSVFKGPVMPPETPKPSTKKVEALDMGFEIVLLHSNTEIVRAGRIPFKVKSTSEGLANAEDIFFKEAQLPYRTDGFRVYRYGETFHEGGHFRGERPVCIGDTVYFAEGALKITLT